MYRYFWCFVNGNPFAKNWAPIVFVFYVYKSVSKLQCLKILKNLGAWCFYNGVYLWFCLCVPMLNNRFLVLWIWMLNHKQEWQTWTINYRLGNNDTILSFILTILLHHIIAANMLKFLNMPGTLMYLFMYTYIAVPTMVLSCEHTVA